MNKQSLLFILACSVFCATGCQPKPALSDKAYAKILEAKDKKAIDDAKKESDKFHLLNDAAKDSYRAGDYEQARTYAEELKAMLPRYDDDWNYGNAIVDVNVVLGRLALQENKVDDAKKYLLAAGETTGSPQLNTYGPNMGLALDLLRKGESDVVLQFLKQCTKFWDMGKIDLKQWTDTINKKKIPVLSSACRQNVSFG